MSSNKIVVLLFGIALLSRLSFISPWLQDWDSVQFALGAQNFNVVLHQPHPPGYPLYILLTKLLNLFFRNITISLTFLSALAGASLVIPLFILTQKMFDRSSAIIATCFYLVLPVSWVMSEVATSNTLGLFLLTCWGLIIFLSGSKNSFIIGLIAGLILGFRASDFPIILSILGLVTLNNISFKFISLLALGFLIGLILWLIPTAFLTGFGEYFQATKDTADYVRWHDTLLGQAYPLKTLVKLRAIYLQDLMKVSFTLSFLIISIIGFLNIFKQKKFLKIYKYQLLLVWFFSYFLMLLFYYNLELAQYTLPLTIPLVIISGNLFSVLLKINKSICSSLYFVIIIYLFSISFPQVLYQAKTIPATINPVMFINNSFNPREVTVISTFLYRQFQFYAPEFTNYYGAKNIKLPINTEYVVLDYLKTQDMVDELRDYKLIESKTYLEKINQFVRIKEANVYILKRSSN